VKKPGKLVVFDLDDTLFPEREYVRSGFRHISQRTADSGGLCADTMFEFLWGTSADPQARGQIFNRLIDRYPSIGRMWTVDALLRAYRCHSPAIQLYAGVQGMLDVLRKGEVGMGVITDGAPDSQRRKLLVLGLLEKIPAVVITDEFGIEYRKPSAFAYSRINCMFKLSPESCIYVGDNPAKDFFGARLLRWKTVRLRMAGQYHEHAEAVSSEFEPDAEVASIDKLKSYLLDWVTDQTATAMS
jgi:putative hydrolase of the HAD superfamily